MTTTDRARLRELAEAATPGPWPAMTWYGSEDGGHAAIGPHHEPQPIGEQVEGGAWVEIEREDDEPGGPVERRAMRDAVFIAAANPAAVLALLDALDRVEAARDEAVALAEKYLQDGHKDYGDHLVRLELVEAERDEARRQAVADFIDSHAKRLAEWRGGHSWDRMCGEERDTWASAVNDVLNSLVSNDDDEIADGRPVAIAARDSTIDELRGLLGEAHAWISRASQDADAGRMLDRIDAALGKEHP